MQGYHVIIGRRQGHHGQALLPVLNLERDKTPSSRAVREYSARVLRAPSAPSMRPIRTES